MKFTIEMVNEYLTIVNDENPIHRSIVPGQLICEKVFSELNVNWMNYKIKYLKPVSYTHLTLPTKDTRCRSRWSPYH